jgi:hypothetical protein
MLIAGVVLVVLGLAWLALNHRRRHPRRRGKLRKQHIDSYHELQLDGADPADLPVSLLEVTSQSFADRRRLLADEATRTELSPLKGEGEAARRMAAHDLDRASQHMKEDMRKRGAKERAHYYSASERSQTGEVDRTYDVDPEDRPKKRKQ